MLLPFESKRIYAYYTGMAEKNSPIPAGLNLRSPRRNALVRMDVGLGCYYEGEKTKCTRMYSACSFG